VASTGTSRWASARAARGAHRAARARRRRHHADGERRRGHGRRRLATTMPGDAPLTGGASGPASSASTGMASTSSTGSERPPDALRKFPSQVRHAPRWCRSALLARRGYSGLSGGRRVAVDVDGGRAGESGVAPHPRLYRKRPSSEHAITARGDGLARPTGPRTWHSGDSSDGGEAVLVATAAACPRTVVAARMASSVVAESCSSRRPHASFEVGVMPALARTLPSRPTEHLADASPHARSSRYAAASDPPQVGERSGERARDEPI
jgi:hypothetical protein